MQEYLQQSPPNVSITYRELIRMVLNEAIPKLQVIIIFHREITRMVVQQQTLQIL